MKKLVLARAETKFEELIWTNEPLTTQELIKLSEKEMNWKRTTTYSVLKRLCDKGIFKNENSVVSATFTRNEFYAKQSRRYVEDTFGGSPQNSLRRLSEAGSLTILKPMN